MNELARNRVALWPFAIEMDSSGKATIELQSIYSRGLCRAFAEGLIRADVCDVALCLPVITIGEITSWVVSGKELALNEALAISLPDNTDFIAFGAVSVTDRIEFHLRLVCRSRQCLLVDQDFRYCRTQIPTCLSDAVICLASAITGLLCFD
jgi:hypothetical protein